MADSPLEGCLGVCLDRGVDGTGISLGLGGAVGGWRSISFDSTIRDSLAEVCWDRGSGDTQCQDTAADTGMLMYGRGKVTGEPKRV